MKTINRLNACCSLLTALVCSLLCADVRAQYVDVGLFKNEHLITNSINGETGDVSIYVSFPNWFGEPGYCPIRVRVVPRKGLLFKQSGMLKVTIGQDYYSSFGTKGVVVEIPIEKGKGEATGELLGNFLIESAASRGYQFGISAKLNDRKLSGQSTYIYNSRGIGVNTCKSLVLISDETSKDDVRRMEALAEMGRTGNWFSQEQFVTQSSQSSSYCDVRNMPWNWLCLSTLEQISISLEDLERIDAKGLECLSNYVLAGGFLAISKVRAQKTVATLLSIDLSRKYGESKRSKSRTGAQAKILQLSDFQSPSLDLFENTIWDKHQMTTGRGFLNGEGLQPNLGYVPAVTFSDFYEATDWFAEKLGEVGTSILDSKLASPIAFASEIYDAVTFVEDAPEETMMVAHGFGIVCLESRRRADYANVKDETFGKYRSSSNAAMPVTVASGNRTVRLSSGVGDDFWTWLIPSVGRTPAIAFLTFVVLFVGVAVPGIMVWSNRHKRRVWLVVLIPITATICTFFLFSYGLLKDGLGAVSRIRSLAFVDQNGDGLVWSRQTYFAATVSNDGISIAPETQFNPIMTSSFISLPTSEQVESNGQQKYLGFLPPRLQTQFSIAHPVKKLPILKRGPEQDTFFSGQVIRNASVFKWDKAVFVGENDTYYMALDVEPGDKAELAVTSRADAISELQRSYKSQPLVPPTDSPSVDQTSLGQVFTSYFGYRYNQGSNVVGQITEEGVWQNQLGKATSDRTVLLPGTYVIFAHDAPYVERCLPNVRDQEGLHTIVGRW
ncbi:MAG: hypothetical protein NTY15_19790 [Planctomycetota bacterium]|nr:hypothetical protein [Planctomycetota bacterium]